MQTFDFVKWLQENSNCEDPDSQLLFSPRDFNGGVAICDNEGDICGLGKTLEEACNDFTKKVKEKYGYIDKD